MGSTASVEVRADLRIHNLVDRLIYVRNTVTGKIRAKIGSDPRHRNDIGPGTALVEQGRSAKAMHANVTTATQAYVDRARMGQNRAKAWHQVGRHGECPAEIGRRCENRPVSLGLRASWRRGDYRGESKICTARRTIEAITGVMDFNYQFSVRSYADNENDSETE
jgi:hypothetical protein